MPAHQGKISTSTEAEKLLWAMRATYPDACSPRESAPRQKKEKKNNFYGQRGPRILMPAHQGKTNTSPE
jgi:hypothetical protein